MNELALRPIESNLYEGPIVFQGDDWSCVIRSIENCAMAFGSVTFPTDFITELEKLANKQQGLSFAQLRDAAIRYGVDVILSPLSSREQLIRLEEGMSLELSIGIVNHNYEHIQHVIDSGDGLLINIAESKKSEKFHAVCVVGYFNREGQKFIQLIDPERGLLLVSVDELSRVIIDGKIGEGQLIFLRVHFTMHDIEIIEEQ